MERWVNRVALVTGASSGIGADFLRCLVKHGLKVIGCARRVDMIQNITTEVADEKGTVIAYQCDVSKAEERVRMINFIKEKHGGVDICINNAGFGSATPLLECDSSVWSDMLEVNVVAATHLIQLSIQSMRERGITDGYIININSLAGHALPPPPYPAMYPASKHALRVITEGFRRELRQLKSPIRISEISPGLIETGFTQVSRSLSEEEAKQFYSSRPCMTTTDMNDALIYMLSTPPQVEVHDILIRATQGN